MAVKSKALASVPDIDFGNYFDSWYQTSSAEAIRRSQGWAIPLQGTRQGITLWFWFLGVVFLSGRLAFLFPHLRKKILSGSLCGFFFFNFEREQCFLLNSCGWIAPKFHPPPQSVYSRLPHLHMWIRSQETFMRVSCVYSWSLVDGTRVTRERT